MIVKQITTHDEELEIIEATLLTVEEAEGLPSVGFDEIGRYVFLTYEEAEAKLKEMKK